MTTPTVTTVSQGAVEFALDRGHRGTVVVMHGSHARAGLQLGEAALVAAGYTVLTPSRPGYGRTPRSTGPGPERFADATAELCAQLGLHRVLAVVGVSSGGPAAVALAARHPSLVRSLVLHGARSSLPFPTGATRLAATIAFHPAVEPVTWWGVRTLMRWTPHLGLLFMLGNLSTLPARRVVADLSPADRRRLRSTFAAMRSGRGFADDVAPAEPLERAVLQPALVIASRADRQVGWSHVDRFAHALAHATVWESPSLSHLLWVGSGAASTDDRTLRFLSCVEADLRPSHGLSEDRRVR